VEEFLERLRKLLLTLLTIGGVFAMGAMFLNAVAGR
jgi:hypothetical protein